MRSNRVDGAGLVNNQSDSIQLWRASISFVSADALAPGYRGLYEGEGARKEAGRQSLARPKDRQGVTRSGRQSRCQKEQWRGGDAPHVPAAAPLRARIDRCCDAVPSSCALCRTQRHQGRANGAFGCDNPTGTSHPTTLPSETACGGRQLRRETQVHTASVRSLPSCTRRTGTSKWLVVTDDRGAGDPRSAAGRVVCSES